MLLFSDISINAYSAVVHLLGILVLRCQAVMKYCSKRQEKLLQWKICPTNNIQQYPTIYKQHRQRLTNASSVCFWCTTERFHIIKATCGLQQTNSIITTIPMSTGIVTTRFAWNTSACGYLILSVSLHTKLSSKSFCGISL